jgi:DNA polymerase III sliding clamp (beta) subunit (PCNA family)
MRNGCAGAAARAPTVLSTQAARIVARDSRMGTMLLQKSDFCVRHAACRDVSRYNLHGVRIEPQEGDERARLVATDGHMLLMLDTVMPPSDEYPVLPDVEGAHRPVLEPHTVPLDTVNAIVKALPKCRTSMPVLSRTLVDGGLANDGTEQRLRFHITDLETHVPIMCREIEGEYPAYDQILPKDEPVATVTLDARLLGSILKAVSELRTHTLTIELRGEQEDYLPVVMRSEHEGSKLTAVLMPMRV